jgi:hypothetical protein
MTANYVLAIPITSADTTGISDTPIAVNEGGLPNACYMIRLTNTSTEPIYFSIGYSDVANDVLLPGISTEIYAQSNAQKRDTGFFKAGTEIWINGTASTGDFYVAGYYQPQI